MWLSKYFVYFIIYSFMGWIYESIFCTIKNGKWEKRGFLYGPICPIYGVGATTMTYIGDIVEGVYHREFIWWHIFLVAFLGSIVLEYLTSYVLEKLFHAYWWDYSNIPFNIKGRVCLPASLGFGVAGLVVTYWVAPFTRRLVADLPLIALELMSLIFMAILSADLTLTVSALTQFEQNVIAVEAVVNQHMEQFVTGIQDSFSEKKQAAETLLEERTRFSRENMEQALRNMNESYRLAIKRVKGMRITDKEKGKKGLTRQVAFDTVKKYIKPRRKW